MNHHNNKKTWILMAASLALVAPMAMAQTTQAQAAGQVNAAHDHAAAQTQAESNPPAQTPTPPSAPPAPTEEVKWSELDVDGNGNLSLTEVEAQPGLVKVFTQVDANADGELTQDEYKAWLASNDAGGGKTE